MMEISIPVVIAGVAGFIFGFLVGWLVGLKTKNKKPASTKKELPPDAVAFLTSQEPATLFDVHVARVDIERNAMIGVMHHIDDLVEELKEDGELKNLLRLVILGYDVEGDKLARVPELCSHFMKIHQDRPFLAVFLDKKSMMTYLQFLLNGRKQAGLIPEHPVEPPLDTLEQEIVGQTTQLLSSILGDRPEIMSHLLDQLLGRLEEVCNAMEQKEQQRISAALQPAS